MIPTPNPPFQWVLQGWSPNALRPPAGLTIQNATAPASLQLFNGMAMFAAKGTLSAAQLDTLNASPVEIVSAPGAAKVILPVFFQIYTRIPTGSNWTGAGNYNLQHTTAAIQLNSGAIPSNLNAAGPRNTLSCNSGWTYNSITSAINQGISIRIVPDVVPGGAGQADALWWFWYTVVDSMIPAV
jgi:hypothetical protein